MWFYVQRVLVPYQKADAAAHGRPRGNLSDLYPRWLGTRELLLHHRNPYSAEVTREIQIGYYGRPLDPERADDPGSDEPKDQQGFAYPLHVVFLLAPTIGLPFPVVQAGFRWLLIILTLASVFLWLRVLRWRPSATVTAILIVLTFGSYAVVQGIKLQQLTLVVSALLAGCAAALVAGYFALAGFLLALATIKPQLALPVAGWLVLWAVSDWRRRQIFCLEFRSDGRDFSRRLRIYPAGMDWAISRRRRRLSPVHRRSGFAARRAGHAGTGENSGRSGRDRGCRSRAGEFGALRRFSRIQHHAGAGSGGDAGDRAHLCAL